MSHQIELTLARRVIRKALSAGYLVSVCDGEEYPVKRSTKFGEIDKALASTDSDVLVIRAATGDRLGSVLLVWGNGEDVVSDYTDKPEIAALVA